MTKATGTIPEKKPYSKPRLSAVKFVVDEAVFNNCKLLNTGNGPAGWPGPCAGTAWGGWACDRVGS